MVRNRIYSLKFAVQGIWTAFQDQPNIKIHFLIAIIVLLAAGLFQVTLIEWLILIVTAGFVISLEMINTAIEEIVDSFVDGIHPAAKKAKDVAAGAVLIVSITALAIGAVIFLPYLLALITPQ